MGIFKYLSLWASLCRLDIEIQFIPGSEYLVGLVIAVRTNGCQRSSTTLAGGDRVIQVAGLQYVCIGSATPLVAYIHLGRIGISGFVILVEVIGLHTTTAQQHLAVVRYAADGLGRAEQVSALGRIVQSG